MTKLELEQKVEAQAQEINTLSNHVMNLFSLLQEHTKALQNHAVGINNCHNNLGLAVDDIMELWMYVDPEHIEGAMSTMDDLSELNEAADEFREEVQRVKETKEKQAILKDLPKNAVYVDPVSKKKISHYNNYNRIPNFDRWRGGVCGGEVKV